MSALTDPTHHSRRRDQSDKKILEAAVTIIRTRGFRAVTIEAVASLSGVAKTTIYRRYRDRFELLEAVSEFVDEQSGTELRDPPLTREGLVMMLEHVRNVFENQVGLRLVADLLTSDDEFMETWRARVVNPRLEATRSYFTRGIDAGILNPDVDYQVIIEMIVGAMVMAEAIRGDVPGGWADQMVAVLWPTISAA